MIIFRSLLAASFLYLGFIALKHSLDPGRTWSFSAAAFQSEAHSSLTVFGGLLAAIYASLYARFAAQWSYLAGLYNKLLETEVALYKEAGLTPDLLAQRKRDMAFWKASFVEDADDLHLATKKMFIPAILEWLSEPEVKACFVAGTIGGQERLTKLVERLAAAKLDADGVVKPKVEPKPKVESAPKI